MPTATAVPTTSTAIPLSPALGKPPNLPAAKVVKVVDGDTVDVSLNGTTTRLRLIGIDTPEVVDPRKPVQCFGREASARAHEILDGQTVALEADVSQGEYDSYGRLLRYVWLPDGQMFNFVMIAEGYAHEYTYNLPYKYMDVFKRAQGQAREASRGLWGRETCNGNTAQAAASVGQLTATSSPPAPAAPVAAPGATVQFLSVQGAPPGGRATVTVQTAGGAVCSIVYVTPAGTVSTAQGLTNKTADASGRVSWSWSIGTSTRPGAGAVRVTCNGVMASTSIQIG